jgi:threonine dehydrogenase-like Zn-dependent dehydrogenase
VDIDEEDPYKIVQYTTDGRGADITIECSGAPQAFDMDFDLVRKQVKYLQAELLDRGNPV